MTEEERTAILCRARQLLERGWCQNTPAAVLKQVQWGRALVPASVYAEEAPTHYCITGAVRRATFELFGTLGLMTQWMEEFVLSYLLQTMPKTTYSLAAYNDTPGRRQRTILKRFDIAIRGK